MRFSRAHEAITCEFIGHGIELAVDVADGPVVAGFCKLPAQVVALSEEAPQMVAMAAPFPSHHHDDEQGARLKDQSGGYYLKRPSRSARLQCRVAECPVQSDRVSHAACESAEPCLPPTTPACFPSLLPFLCCRVVESPVQSKHCRAESPLHNGENRV